MKSIIFLEEHGLAIHGKTKDSLNIRKLILLWA